MLPELRVDPEKEVRRITEFIQGYMEKAGYSRAVLGVSGGVDSALVAALCARALGPENVYAMILPYKTSNPLSTEHGRRLIRQLGIHETYFEITPMVDPLLAADPAMSEVRRGNIMSRCRMVILFDHSAAVKGLVMGTGNRTEFLLGYFTLYGDSAAALRPILHLYKCQVRVLAAFLGVPEEIIAKAPSADLWQGQTDEGELGFTYDQADQILFLLTERSLDEEEIARQGFDREVVKAVKRRMERTAFKRQEPPSLPTVFAAGQ